MLKHERIIKKMTRQQKVALLTDVDALSGMDAAGLGIPAVKSARLDDMAEKYNFPSYGSLSASWDTDLVYQMAYALAAEARRTDRVNLMITPDIKSAANAYGGGLSEDACLNGAIAVAIAQGVHADGSACALSRFSCSAEDVKLLDNEENPQAVFDLFCKPFYTAMREAPCEAVISSLYRPCGGYTNVNVRLFSEALSSDFGDNVYVVSEQLSEDVRFQSFLDRGVCVKGGEITIDRALGRYEQLLRSVKDGSITQNDLQGAIDSGIAIRTETVDLAVDKIIEKAFNINQLKPISSQQFDLEKLAYRAAVESIVLLKNGGVLPLTRGTRVAVIGKRCEQFESLSGLNITAVCDGFSGISDEVVTQEDAKRAADKADVILMFLNRDGESEADKLALPANMLTLIRQLKDTGKRMVAILPSDKSVDMSFDCDFSAVLAAPLESVHCSAALGAVISGMENPSGRLARSFYDRADLRFKVIREDRDGGRIKIGSFSGYRMYDAAREKVRYPFGHGLSYASFAYSGLRVNKESVSFTIKNVGKCAGCEVAQIYVGSPHYPHIRKELKAFVRVYLKAGEKREVTVDLPSDCFEYYDVKSMTRKTYSGVYKIYVGASVLDIRLKGAVNIKGESFAQIEKIEKENSGAAALKQEAYRLSAENGIAPRKKRRWFKGISLAVMLAALAAFLLMGVLTYLYDSIENYVNQLIIIGAVFLVALIALIIEGVVHRSYAERAAESANKTVAFSSPVLSTSTPQDVFEAAFTKIEANKTEQTKNKFDEPKYLDKDFTFEVIRKELEIFTAERGCKINTYNMCRLVAAFAASRAIVFPASAEPQLNRLAPVLSEYFGSELITCDAILSRNVIGALSGAAKEAESNPEKIFITFYRRIDASSFDRLVFAKTYDHALRLGRLGKNEDFVIPPNLWIIATLAEGESLKNIPSNTAEAVGLMNLEMTETELSDRTTAVRPLGFYQFDNLCGGIRGEFEMDEGMWKRIDRFEETLGEDVFHSVGNRTWVKMEKFAAVYLACGGGALEALDGAVASQLLVALQAVLNDKNVGSEQLLATLGEIFGQDNISYCRKIVSTYFEDEADNKGDEAL